MSRRSKRPNSHGRLARREFLCASLAGLGGSLLGMRGAVLRADEPAGVAPLAIGSRIEMFVDGWLIADRKRVEHRLHPPARREVVLALDQPWEGPSSAYYTLFRDGAKIRLYYRGSASYQKGQTPPVSFCYAESDDGVHFTRPSLGLFEHDASRDNNIIHRGPLATDNFTPFLDTNPHAKPEERYKAVAAGPAGGQLFAFGSPDGIRWSLLQDTPISADGSFDSLNVPFWDELSGQYRLFSRYLDVPGIADNPARNRAVWQEGTTAEWVRAIQSSTSPDFRTWSPAVPHRYAEGVPREHFYTNATVQCPGAPHMLLSFPKRFIETRRVLPEAEHEYPGVSDAVFMSSRDGVNWDRTFAEAWLRPGPDLRNWTQRGNMPALGVLETGPDEFSMYASEHYEWPTNRLRRLTMRRHGFGSLHAGAARGEFTTKPLTFRGSQLTLNYATSAAGSVRVEIQDDTGRPLPGFTLADCRPIFGDEFQRAVTWNPGGDVSPLADKPVRLRVELVDADLFALRFAPG